MGLEGGSVVLGSVETDNDGIRNNRGPENQELNGNARIQNNGSCNVEINYHGDSDPMGKGTEVSCLGSSFPVDANSEASPSPSVTRKGYGLKKWRRIKRDPGKSSKDATASTSQHTPEDRSNSAVNPSKRVQVYADRKDKSENSVSSTNAVVKSLDGFASFGEPSLGGADALFRAGSDSENSEDRGSKSSTATSGQPVKLEKPVGVGFPHDKSRLRTMNGKNLTHSVQRGQHGKVRVETMKKPRGVGSVKIEKETSLSSLESDSCSSNFVFMPGTSSTNNGTQSEKLFDCDGEFDGVGQGGKDTDSKEGHENVSPVDEVADSSWEVKVESKEVNGFSANKDSLVEAMDSLHYAQEALEKEVLKFREISKHAEDFISDIHTEVTTDEQLPETSIEQLQFPEMARARNQDVEKEIEELLKSKIEAEVEYLAISSKVRNLWSDALNQITLLNSEQTQIINKLGDTENKTVMLKEEADEFKLAGAEESSKLQKRICKYTSCLFLQMVLLVLIVGLAMLESRSYMKFVPT